MSCKYDREKGDYLLPDGSPCRVDDYGDPTHHCTARRTCSQHVGPGELTCARCIGRTRTDLRQIVERSALMLPVAMSAGVNSEAANLAGPAADVRDWSERRIAMRTYLDTWQADGRITEDQLVHARMAMEDDDEQHPYTVLTRWQMMLAEDYSLELPARLTIATASAFLEAHLHRVAQDDEQDFPLLARELRQVRNHLDGVLRDSRAQERGAPCPDCRDDETYTGVAPRMVRVYGHWCEDETCERIHYSDDSADVWVCPRNRDHWRSHEDYMKYVDERSARRRVG